MKTYVIISIALYFLSSTIIISEIRQQNIYQFNEIILSIPGLSQSEQSSLIAAMDEEFRNEVINTSIREEYLSSVQRVISAGIFEEVEAERIAEVAHKVYRAELRGAPVEYVEELALIGFVQSISALQLEVSAKELFNFSQSDIDPIVYQELISYGLANNWPSDIISGVSQGIIQGHKRGLGKDVRKLALAMIIRVDQGLGNTSIAVMVEEEIRFVQYTTNRQENARREVAYKAMEKMIKAGVPHQIAQELYYEAIEEKWDVTVIQAVFDGMIKAHRIGLTPERIGLAMIIRVEQGLGTTSPEQMVQEEIAFVKEIEKERLKIIRGDSALDYSKPVPKPQREPIFIEPQRREPTPSIFRQRTRLNTMLMESSIKSFLGVPYRWGGNNRLGTDCSGFTQTVFREQGIFIPRNSRQQYRVGLAIMGTNLRFGDLVFFNKYGSGRINHVGIYVGNGMFAHASCSKGVTISRINKRYYHARYVGAKRIV